MSPLEIMWEWAGPEREMARKRRPGDSGEDDNSQDVEGGSRGPSTCFVHVL